MVGDITYNIDSMTPVIQSYLLYNAYTIPEKIKLIQGMNFSKENMVHYVLEENLNETITEYSVPIYIIQGVHDYQTTYNQTKLYFDNIKAPIKDYTFENSAHSPAGEEPEKFKEIIINDILK